MEKTKPIHKIRAGQIVCSIWENPATEGRNFPTNSITLERNYKVGEEWKKSNSLNINDLQKAILVLQKAQEFLFLKQEESEKIINGSEAEAVEDPPKKKFSEADVKKWRLQVKDGNLTPQGFKDLIGEAF